MRMPEDRLGFMTRLAKKYGDVVYFRIGFERVYFSTIPTSSARCS